MPEDKIGIDSGEFEKEAFSAIDDLLPEEPENKKEAEQTEDFDPLTKLDKILLSLDWEISESTVKEFLDTVEKLKQVYPDEANYALLSMMSSLVKFLSIARHLSPPGTIKLIEKVADVFKEINTSTLSLEERQLKVKQVYDDFLPFKKKIGEAKREKAEISPISDKEISDLKAEVFAFRESFDQIQSKLSQIMNVFNAQNGILENLKVKSENFSSQLAKIMEEIAGIDIGMKEIEKTVSPLSRVLIASIDGQLIAFPERCVANVYKISSSKAKEIKKRDRISLGEIKSFWRRLRAGIKGSLSKLKEKELVELEVPVLKSPMGEFFAMEECVYKALVLLEEGEKYGLLLLDKAFSRKAISPLSGRKGQKEWIYKIIEMPKGGEVPLLDVAILFKGN
jgi:predicted  nucleic acid-binding Zn-ribbon protein